VKRDVYLFLNQLTPDGLARVTVYINPLVLWIWVAGVIIAAGGLLAAPALIVTGERRSRIAALAMLSAWLAIAVAGSLTNFVEARFAAQIAPLQWLLEGAVLGLLVTALRARRQPQSAQ
jgi:hypothetical protein